MKFFKKDRFVYNGKMITGHNKVLSNNPRDVSGLKTGYVRQSGFNIISLFTTNNKNYYIIVIGGQSAKIRDARVMELARKYVYSYNRYIPIPKRKPIQW